MGSRHGCQKVDGCCSFQLTLSVISFIRNKDYRTPETQDNVIQLKKTPGKHAVKTQGLFSKRDPAFKWFVFCDQPNVCEYLLASHGLKHIHLREWIQWTIPAILIRAPWFFFPKKGRGPGRKVLHSTGMYQLILVDLLLFVHHISTSSCSSLSSLILYDHD